MGALGQSAIPPSNPSLSCAKLQPSASPSCRSRRGSLQVPKFGTRSREKKKHETASFALTIKRSYSSRDIHKKLTMLSPTPTPTPTYCSVASTSPQGCLRNRWATPSREVIAFVFNARVRFGIDSSVSVNSGREVLVTLPYAHGDGTGTDKISVS